MYHIDPYYALLHHVHDTHLLPKAKGYAARPVRPSSRRPASQRDLGSRLLTFPRLRRLATGEAA